MGTNVQFIKKHPLLKIHRNEIIKHHTVTKYYFLDLKYLISRWSFRALTLVSLWTQH